MKTGGHISELLGAMKQGDDQALEKLFSTVYDTMYDIAKAKRREWKGNHTLNTTALVHEAYLKLVDRGEKDGFNDRVHFYALAAKAMRQILVNYAEKQSAGKRGGGQEKIPIATLSEPDVPAQEKTAEELLNLDLVLKLLAQQNVRQSDVVECRFFADMSVEETAAALGISQATVKRDWQFASAWLYQRLYPEQ